MINFLIGNGQENYHAPKIRDNETCKHIFLGNLKDLGNKK